MATVALAVVTALMLAPAVARPASPWQPFRSSPFDLPAGARCSFPLSGRIVEDRERIRTLSTFADGTPQRQEVAGPLIVRYTNMATGASALRNLTGDARFDHGADGSSTITLVGGHLAVGLAASDPGGPTFLVPPATTTP